MSFFRLAEDTGLHGGPGNEMQFQDLTSDLLQERCRVVISNLDSFGENAPD